MSNDLNDMNPYQSTPPTALQTGDVKKPTSMVVFGIMNLVFGAFTIGAVIIANAVLLIDLPQDPNNP